MVGVDKTRQNHACQEGLTRAGCAKDAGAALDELIQVHAHRVPLFARIADSEYLSVVIRPEYLGDIGGIRQHHRGMVAGYSFDGDWFCLIRMQVFPLAVFLCS